MRELIVDLHIHSRYARATSKNSTLEGLYYWGKIKGISIIGTGDFTHPAWFAELREKLEAAEPGLYQLKAAYAYNIEKTLPLSVRDTLIRFVPSVEIATIYSKNGRVRKVHQLIITPSIEVAAKLRARLEQVGNLAADGRPILGMDSKELLRLCLEIDPAILFIPAHIWTPWFGLFGSKSGFDSIQEAYQELAPEIKAIETGLSSDPAMNWRLSNLDGIAITSHSDAHSPQKLGREATVVKSQLNYDAIIGAFKTNDTRLVGTIEFFPEEGKYHLDGHRQHHVRFTPAESKARHGICPVCGKPLVIGVENRVETLADRPVLSKPPKQAEYIIPLSEIIAELLATKSTSAKGVQKLYFQAIEALGDEFSILRSIPTRDIEAAGMPLLALAIDRLRRKEVVIDPGYDGVYGTISIFKDSAERERLRQQFLT